MLFYLNKQLNSRYSILPVNALQQTRTKNYSGLVQLIKRGITSIF